MNSSQRNRYISLTMALIVMLPLSIIAARWQWSRHLEREAMNALIESNSNTVIELASLSPTTFSISDEYKRVQVSGTYDPQDQLLLRKQTLNGEPGFHVLTPLTLADGTKLLVDRGWIPGEGQAPDPANDVAAPSGDQTIVARLRPLSGGTDPDPSDLPSGQTNSISVASLGTDYPFFVELIDPVVDNGPTPIPLPAIEAGPHLGYVGQWILIGIASISVYITVFRNLRREARQTAN